MKEKVSELSLVRDQLAQKAKKARLTLEDKRKIQRHSDMIQHKGGIRRMMRDAELQEYEDMESDQMKAERKRKEVSSYGK